MLAVVFLVKLLHIGFFSSEMSGLIGCIIIFGVVSLIQR